MLVKATLKDTLKSGLSRIFKARNTSTDEQEDPEKVIDDMAEDMSGVISDAVDAYIRSGEIIVGTQNLTVTSTTPGALAVVSPLTPAKMT